MAWAQCEYILPIFPNRFDKGQQNMGSPAKGTRSSTGGDVGLQREGIGRKK